MGFLYQIQQKLTRFMYGRYGQDPFGLFLLACSVLFVLLARIPNTWWFIFFAYALLIYFLFRVFSKKIENRRKENQFFLGIWYKIKTWVQRKKQTIQDRKYYKLFRCPKCKSKLRAPKGRGHIRVTCRQCGTVFDKKV